MKKIVFFVVIGFLLASTFVLAVSDKGEQRRVLSNDISKESIVFFEEQGCVVKHILRKKVAYSCPRNVVEVYGLKEDVIYELKDSVSVSQVNADDVWSMVPTGYNGTGIKVAILDTGIDLSHLEFQEGDVVAQWDFANGDGTAEDFHNHGTHVAGIITANGVDYDAKGAAPGAEIMIGKVCSTKGCLGSDIEAGIEWAVNNGADVISMSLGSYNVYRGDCDYTDLAIVSNWAVSQGVVVVAAAGNDGLRGVSSPGCASGVIAVGAVDDYDVVARFSNYGSALDVVAPGVRVYSSILGGYDSMSGTSMATPYVAATVALILEAHVDYSVDDVKEALYGAAVDVDKRKDGNGRIDALAAINYVIGGGEDEPEDPEEPSCPPGLAKKGSC